MKIKNIIFFVFLLFPGILQAATLENLKKHFVPGKYYQVQQDEKKYYILTSSPFKDAYARKNLSLMSKAALFKFISKIDKEVTGLDIREFGIKYFYEEKKRLFAISIVEKNNVVLRYEKSQCKGKYTASILEEIAKLEDIDPKTKVIHEQLKELYFLDGDIDNYEKQSDILMEIIFNED